MHAPVGLRREVPDPVVVALRERGRGLRVLDEREVLVEQRREHDRLVDAHRVHVGDARRGVVRAGVDRHVHVGVERADVVDGHARPPDRLAHEPRAVELAARRAVHDREAVPLVVDLVVEGRPRHAAELLGDVAVPDLRRLVDVAVDVDRPSAISRCPSLPRHPRCRIEAGSSGRGPSRASCRRSRVGGRRCRPTRRARDPAGTSRDGRSAPASSVTNELALDAVEAAGVAAEQVCLHLVGHAALGHVAHRAPRVGAVVVVRVRRPDADLLRSAPTGGTRRSRRTRTRSRTARGTLRTAGGRPSVRRARARRA